MDFLIDDYILGGGVRLKSNKDQNFARPIEDEDIFAVGDTELQKDQDENEPAGSSSSSNSNFNSNQDDEYQEELPRSPAGDIEQEDEQVGSTDQSEPQTDGPEEEGPTECSGMELDEIFADDYSRSPEPMRPSTDYSRTTDLAKSNQPPPLTPAQIKIKQLKERIQAQTKSMRLTTQKLGCGFDETGHIEVSIEKHQMVSNSSSKYFFNKLFNKSKKASENNNSPENLKRSWTALRESMRKKICSQRRKVWDSFQMPVDDYDDEEEIVGESTENNDNCDDDEAARVIDDAEEMEENPEEENLEDADEDDQDPDEAEEEAEEVEDEEQEAEESEEEGEPEECRIVEDSGGAVFVDREARESGDSDEDHEEADCNEKADCEDDEDSDEADEPIRGPTQNKGSVLNLDSDDEEVEPAGRSAKPRSKVIIESDEDEDS